MYKPLTDPNALSSILPNFFGGEFIVARGRGHSSEVFTGKVNRIIIPDMNIKTIEIVPEITFERWIGCKADFSPVKRWRPIDVPSGKIVFHYNWFCQQPRHARLKLAHIQTDDRCWFCSYKEPARLDLFRAKLIAMLVEDSMNEPPTLKRLRDWLLARML